MLTLHGSHVFPAPPTLVWSHIFEPASLAKLIPGCQQLTQVSPEEYHGVIRVGIAAVSGTYRTQVKIREQRPPEYCAFDGVVDGPTGAIQGSVIFTLRETMDHRTELTYEAQAMISGALATLSGRLLQSVACSLINQSLACFDRELQAQAAPQTSQ
ncbi:MAG: carbon monoxide dehydrogenase subunit G [Anaerolineae bacterium]|nr:carbon monoxide dehydrogenase subunit G [Anaerolineae bacterium]MDW8070433.1 carbon monoxide dehydrogenase subunit G [Anaerolineae bacterium]